MSNTIGGVSPPVTPCLGPSARYRSTGFPEVEAIAFWPGSAIRVAWRLAAPSGRSKAPLTKLAQLEQLLQEILIRSPLMDRQRGTKPVTVTRVAAHETRADGVVVGTLPRPALDVLLGDIATFPPPDAQAFTTALSHAFFMMAPKRPFF